MFKLDDKQIGLLKAAGSMNETEAHAAQAELTKGLAEEFYQEGILDGDIVSGIFVSETFDEDVVSEYILDLVAPGTEADLIAWYMPDTGWVPERTINMNKVNVPRKNVANSINCPLKFLRQKRVDILGRMMDAMEAGFIIRDNLDGWSVILAAGAGNGAAVEASGTDGVFDFASLRAMKLRMRRQDNGNSTSVGRRIMTDLFLSPEAAEDIRELAHDDADDFTRKEIADRADMDGFRWQGVNFNVLDELGDGQLFQKYWIETLGIAMVDSSTELLIGLDLTPRGKRNFVNPKGMNLEIYEDRNLHRRQEFGWYSWKSRGYAVLNRRVIVIGNA